MCGIVGTYNLTRDHPIDPAAIRRMLGAIRHRGPDEFGLYCFQDERDGIGMGNARLSIIDLASGQQPIGNENGRVWIVFNGEIFNYLELRQDLEEQGHCFATTSDTEVLVHLYEEEGPDFLPRLNGQFAFALWDEEQRRLLLARDRMGIRPLFYTEAAGALLFASEMKALLADPRVTAAIDPHTLQQIFTYWSPLPPRTIFQGIRTVPPGHYLLAQSGQLHLERYWRPDFLRQPGATLPPEEAAAELRRHLTRAVRLRLRADVPVGAYLSGGIDSAAITALASQAHSGRLETFSIAFSDAAFDERPFQEQMAAHLGADHHVITCGHADIGRVFPSVIWHVETPILRTSPAPLYLLSRLVRSHGFKVVLTGEGADEVLAGYNIFREAKVRAFWARQPESTMRPMLLDRLYAYVGGMDNPAYRRKFFGRGLEEVAAPAYSHAIRWGNTARTQRLFAPALRARLPRSLGRWDEADPDLLRLLPPGFAAWPLLSRAQFLESTLFLAEYLLAAQGDRVALAHAVEGRMPFLDHAVVEFSNRLPPHYKLRGLREKFILKQAVADLLPPQIWQREKRPYRAPIHRSFFPDGRAMPWVDELLSPEALSTAGLFDPDAVNTLRRKLDRFGRLGESDDMALAGILSTQLVHHHFVAGNTAPPRLQAGDSVKTVIKRPDKQTDTMQIVR